MKDDIFEDRLVQDEVKRWAPVVILLVVAPILYSIVQVASALMDGDANRASAYGGVLSGLGTIVLFLLTAWYTAETRRMASETEKTRKQEKKSRKRKQEEELNSLRRALLNEIGKIQYFDDLAESYGVGTSALSFVAPTVVYEENAEKIGQLTEKEVDAVVEFYTRVYQIEDLLKLQKEHDLPVGKDAITRYFLSFNLWMEEILRKVTFGKITPTSRDKRTESVKERLRKLDKVQATAIQELENSLEDNSGNNS